jgi:hypothetical protein
VVLHTGKTGAGLGLFFSATALFCFEDGGSSFLKSIDSAAHIHVMPSPRYRINTIDLLQSLVSVTVHLFQMWQFAPNSVHYLLSLWQRMVASVPYVKATEPHLLETYTPEVSNAYITSRLESVAVVVR